MPGKRILTQIERLSSESGFSACGVVSAELLPQAMQEFYLQRLESGAFAEMDYLGRNTEVRFNPSLLFEGAKSIVLFLAPFGENSFVGSRDISGNRMAQYARGRDYHKVIKRRLLSILKELQRECPEIEGRAFTDSAPILERFLAAKAGLGFIGKNNFLISPKFGIRNFIGELVLNVELPVDVGKERLTTTCGECRRCLQACPTGALEAPYRLNANLCTSYLAMESQRLRGIKDRRPTNGWIYGCDCCMDACSWNSRNIASWPEFLHK